MKGDPCHSQLPLGTTPALYMPLLIEAAVYGVFWQFYRMMMICH